MKTARQYFCYIVRCADGTLYTGWTVDVPARVKTHNAGRGGRYTRLRRPVQLVYSEPLPSRAAAMRREAAIKKWRRSRKIALVSAYRRPFSAPCVSGDCVRTTAEPPGR